MSKESRLVSTAYMAKRIGLAQKTLLAHRTDYKEKTHWVILNKNAARPTYRWHLRNMLKEFGL